MRFVSQQQGQDISFSIESLDGRRLKMICQDQVFIFDVLKLSDRHYSVLEGHRSHDIRFVRDDSQALTKEGAVNFTLQDESSFFIRSKADESVQNGQIVAPMSGKVIDVKVKVGDKVGVGEALVVVEAMKMENEFRSPIQGIVENIAVSPGDTVERGVVMMSVGVS